MPFPVALFASGEYKESIGLSISLSFPSCPNRREELQVEIGRTCRLTNQSFVDLHDIGKPAHDRLAPNSDRLPQPRRAYRLPIATGCFRLCRISRFRSGLILRRTEQVPFYNHAPHGTSPSGPYQHICYASTRISHKECIDDHLPRL